MCLRNGTPFGETVVAKPLLSLYRPGERGRLRVKNRAYWKYELEREAAVEEDPYHESGWSDLNSVRFDFAGAVSGVQATADDPGSGGSRCR